MRDMGLSKVFSNASTVLVAVAGLALSACGGGGNDSPTPGGGGGGPGQDPIGQLRFSVLNSEVGEEVGTANITVERIGGSRGEVSVMVTSGDGTATAGADYEAVNTTITFANGDSAPKAVPLKVIDDLLDEPGETVIFVLTNPTGGATIASTTTIVFINDNDEPVAAAPAPPALALGFEIKKVAFVWTSVPGASSYKFMVRERADLAFTQSGADRPANENAMAIKVPVHLYDWSSPFPAYRVDACNPAGCTPSQVVEAPRIGSVAATGYLKASDPTLLARFGYSVAVSGNGATVAVGAPFANEESGAVYIYTAPVSGPVLAPQPLKISAPSAQKMRFGISVALNETGDLLAVGAPFDDHRQSGVSTYPAIPNGDAIQSGGVFVYSRVNGAWSTTPVYIKASDVDLGDQFGSAVALSDTTLLVGAPKQDSPTDGIEMTNAAIDSGAVYAFVATNGGWVQSSRIIKASNIGSGDNFGSAVAMSDAGDIVIVGAPNEDGDGTGIDPVDTETKENSGAAYRFVRSDPGNGLPPEWTSPQRFKAMNSGAGDLYGSSVAVSASGDVLAVGAPQEDGTSLEVPNDEGDNVGAVYVYTRLPAGNVDVAYLKALHRADSALYGSSLALSGDGNILAVGSPGDALNQTGVDGDASSPTVMPNGAVDVLVRQAGALWSSQDLSVIGKHYVKPIVADIGDLFGSAVSLSSDGNTMLVGARAEDGNGRNINSSNNPSNNTIADSGAAYLY